MNNIQYLVNTYKNSLGDFKVCTNAWNILKMGGWMDDINKWTLNEGILSEYNI